MESTVPSRLLHVEAQEHKLVVALDAENSGVF